MLIREGDQRSMDIDIRLAALLSGVAGAVNAAAFQATGFFSANMTGNVSALSDNIGIGQFGAAGALGALVIAFIVGAFSSGLLIEAGRKRRVRAIYAYSIAAEAFLLVLLGFADVMVPELLGGLGLILGLSFVMGIQNAATTRITNARVRTTHVSGMATDIGLGLAALAARAPDREPAIARMRLYLVTIACFLVGGIVGVGLYMVVGGHVFTLAGFLLLAVAVGEAVRARKA
jgi:uncharacterized membrane protein YoaK (UPF0700 family)